MKNLKILLWIGALIILLFLVINAVYAPVVTDDEYLNAYFVIMDDITLRGNKFTKDEFIDVIDFYLSERDLDKCVSVAGSKSGEPMHHILSKAGLRKCMEGWECSSPGDHCCDYDPDTGNYIEYVCQ